MRSHETTSSRAPAIAYQGSPGPLCYRRVVRAVYAARFGGDDPLSNLAIGDRPDPRPPAGWALVRVTAASLNHHDLWTLRGVSSQPLNTPQILGCDAVGRVEERGEDTGGALAPEPGWWSTASSDVGPVLPAWPPNPASATVSASSASHPTAAPSPSWWPCRRQPRPAA